MGWHNSTPSSSMEIYGNYSALWRPFSSPRRCRDMLSGHVPMGSAFANFYNIFKQKNLPFGGVYWAFTPMFIPVDVQLIKAMLVKDFAYFQDRGKDRISEVFFSPVIP